MARCAIVAAVLCLLSVHLCAAEDDVAQLIKKKAEECATAMQKGDYEKVAELTYPKALEILGGKKKAAETIASYMDEMEIQGITIASYTVGDVSAIVTENDTQYAIVHTVVKMNCPKGILTQNSFLVAVSPDKGKTWSFVDGNAVDQLKQINFPMPKNLKIPKAEEPKLSAK